MKKKTVLLFLGLALVAKAEAQNTSALAMADSLYAVGDYSEAIKEFDKIAPKTEALYLKIARAHQAKGTLDNALTNYKKAATGTDKAVAMNEYGKLLIAKKKWLSADSVFTQLVGAYATNPNFHYQRGRARKYMEYDPEDSIQIKKMEEYAHGLPDFKKAVALDSTHQRALYETALAHLKKKQPRIVEKLCKKALESYPDNVEIISLLAQNDYSRGYVTDASRGFERLLELGQKSQFIHENLGNCYYKNSHYKKAIDQYLEVLDYVPNDAHTHLILAKLYNLNNDFDNAVKHGEIALEIKTLPIEEYYYTMANIHKTNKKWRPAMEYINKAIAENPNDPVNLKSYYAKAVIADNYYEDKQEVLKLYEDYLARWNKNHSFVNPLAERRIQKLKNELFMAEGG